MSTATDFARHPKTGLPVQPVPDFKVGDLVTERFLGDGYPGVVVARTAKTVWVAQVEFVGNFAANDLPGHNGYGDSGTIAVDPDSVARALAVGKDGARKYVHRVYARPTTSGSLNERETYGGDFHRAKWALPNSGAGSLAAGASYRQDPHV